MEIKIKDNEIVVDGKTYVLKEDIKPLPIETEFKVGDWIVGEDYSAKNSYYPQEPCRVTEVDGKRVYYNKKNGDLTSQTCAIRHATKDEVESYLIGVAKEKGFVDGVFYKHICEGTRCTLVDFEGLWYNDSLEILTDGNGGSIYDDGKWATILPNKKPVPKTKEGFNQFLGAWANRHTHTTDEFLDQYDFNEQIS